MPAITREQFFQAIDAKTERVPLPELGPDAYAVIRSLGAPGLLDLQKRFGSEIKSASEENAARLLVHCLVDDDGRPLFDPHDAAVDDQVRRVCGGRGYLLAKLADVALRLSGLPLTKAAEDAEKN